MVSFAGSQLEALQFLSGFYWTTLERQKKRHDRICIHYFSLTSIKYILMHGLAQRRRQTLVWSLGHGDHRHHGLNGLSIKRERGTAVSASQRGVW